MLTTIQPESYPSVESVAHQLYDDLKATTQRNNERTLIDNTLQYALLTFLTSEPEMQPIFYQHMKDIYDEDSDKTWINDITTRFQNTSGIFYETYEKQEQVMTPIRTATLHQFVTRSLAELFGLQPTQEPQNLANHLQKITPPIQQLVEDLMEPGCIEKITDVGFKTIRAMSANIYMQAVLQNPAHELELGALYENVLMHTRAISHDRTPEALMHDGIVETWLAYLEEHLTYLPPQQGRLRSLFDGLIYFEDDDVWLSALVDYVQIEEANKKRQHYALVVTDDEWAQIEPLFQLPHVTGSEMVNACINTWYVKPFTNTNTSRYSPHEHPQLAFWNGNPVYSQHYPTFGLTVNLQDGGVQRLFGDYDPLRNEITFPIASDGTEHLIHVYMQEYEQPVARYYALYNTKHRAYHGQIADESSEKALNLAVNFVHEQRANGSQLGETPLKCDGCTYLQDNGYELHNVSRQTYKKVKENVERGAYLQPCGV